MIKFYLDRENTGNHSLNLNSAKGGRREGTLINAIDIKKECIKWQSSSRPIFYKSDIQGYDELILSEIPTEFWDKVYGGIFEVRRIDGKSYSREKLRMMLGKFKNKTVNTKLKVNTNEIIEFIEGPSDEADIDICFWNFPQY